MEALEKYTTPNKLEILKRLVDEMDKKGKDAVMLSMNAIRKNSLKDTFLM
jgi:hypothetical protein